MPRTTDTRRRVREIAERIARDGGTPTPTAIRQVLGTGSPNTIHDELSKWLKERSHAVSPAKAVAAPAPAPAPDNAFVEMLEAVLLRQDGAASAIAALAESLGPTPAVLQTVVALLQQMATQVSEDRRWMEQELKASTARFEGVQKHMLLQIDEARLEASRWKEQHQKVRAEFSTWQETMRQKNQRLVDEVNWLRGKAGLPVLSDLVSNPASVLTPIQTGGPDLDRPPVSYPGHPRALIQADE